jgi:hypothetical protein
MARQGQPAGAKPGTRKHADRRASMRYAPAQQIICYWTRDGGDYFAGRVCDVSADGVCLLVRGRLEPGELLSVELINAPRTFLCTREVRVARVFQGSGDDAVIGGTFERRLDYDELLPFAL